MRPVVNGLEADYGDKINFIHLDIDDPATEAWKTAFNYRYQPQAILLGSDGKPITQWLGVHEPNELREIFDTFLE